MSSLERTRLLIGGLLIVASLALGAGLADERAPASQTDPQLLATMHARAPHDAPAREAAHAPTDAPGTRPLPLASGPGAPGITTAAAPLDGSAAAGARERVHDAVEDPLLVLEGGASWVSDRLAGRATASGEPYDPRALVAAHRALPFGTRLRVTNLGNGKSVEVRVVDRGPFIAGRIIDLSRAAAERIGIIDAGHSRVRVEILEYGA